MTTLLDRQLFRAEPDLAAEPREYVLGIVSQRPRLKSCLDRPFNRSKGIVVTIEPSMVQIADC